jgi:hypothetical protein
MLIIIIAHIRPTVHTLLVVLSNANPALQKYLHSKIYPHDSHITAIRIITYYIYTLVLSSTVIPVQTLQQNFDNNKNPLHIERDIDCVAQILRK